MSAYNVIAQSPGGMTVNDVVHGLTLFGYPPKKRQLERCLARLHSRGYIKADSRLSVIDPMRRLVTLRDRSDANSKDGGWRGWAARDPRGYRIPLDRIVSDERKRVNA